MKIGASAFDIELLAEKILSENGCKPAFKGYNGYPYITNVSVNEEVIHGFPIKQKIFKNGDIVSLDVGAIYDGYYGDGAYTYIVEENGWAVEKKLVSTTQEALMEAIKIIKPGIKLGDISYTVQRYVEEKGFGIVRDFVGHGVGASLHEDPQVPNYGRPGNRCHTEKGNDNCDRTHGY